MGEEQDTYSELQEELSKYGKILEDAYQASKEITSVRNRDWLGMFLLLTRHQDSLFDFKTARGTTSSETRTQGSSSRLASRRTTCIRSSKSSLPSPRVSTYIEGLRGLPRSSAQGMTNVMEII